MGLFNLFKKEPTRPEDIDYMAVASEFEAKGDFPSAIEQYKKAIEVVFAGKPERAYRHITRKIVACYQKLGDYDRVFDIWKDQFDPSDYGAKEMYELIKILEAAQRLDLVSKVYDQAGNKLIRNKLDFLIKQKKIPEANALVSGLLVSVPESSPIISDLWLTKAKLCLSLKKWEEAAKYLNKFIERNPHNEEARRLKEFCMKQVRMS